MLIMPQPQSLHELSQQCSTTVRSFSIFRRDASGQRNNWHNHPLCLIKNQKESCLRAALPTLASLRQQDFIMVSGIRSFLIVLTACSSKEQKLSMLWCFSWCFLVSRRGSVLCSCAKVTYLPICKVTCFSQSLSS